MKPIRVGLIVTSLFWVLSALAQKAVSNSVDEYISSEMQRQHIPGLALLVSREGKIVKAQGYGAIQCRASGSR